MFNMLALSASLTLTFVSRSDRVLYYMAKHALFPTILTTDSRVWFIWFGISYLISILNGTSVIG